MNFALGAIIIFLLLSPGISFRAFFLKSDSLRSNIDASILAELLFVVIPNIFIHCISLSILWHYKATIYLEQIYYLIVGANRINGLEFQPIQSGINYFFVYILVLCLVSAIAGKCVQWLVLRFDLDRSFFFLKVANEWEYLFEGRILDKRQRKQLLFVQVDIMLSTSEGDTIYCGILKDYTLNKTQGLDKISIYNVFRRTLNKDSAQISSTTTTTGPTYTVTPSQPTTSSFQDKGTDNRYYTMPGDFFVIPYSQIKNINIKYHIGIIQTATTP